MNSDLLLYLLPGLTVFLLLLGLYKVVYEKKIHAQENIQDLLSNKGSSGSTSILGGLHGAQDILKKRHSGGDSSWAAKIEMKLERGNLMIKVNEFILISIGCVFLTFLVLRFGMSLHPALALVLGAIGFFLPLLYLNVRIWLRMNKAQAQFADVLDNLVNCFKTGYGFSRAIQVVGDNFDDPWGTEFGKMAAEMSLGCSQEDTLEGLSKRVPTPDVDLFVTGVMIQKETGGNLAELLGTLSNTCRERYKLKRKVSAITAQGKLSAGIVSLVPFILTGVMSVFMPEAMDAWLHSAIGMVVMGIAGGWMLLGICILFKIVNIEV